MRRQSNIGWSLFVLLALACAPLVAVVACDEDGVTPDCPPMPRINNITGEVEANRYGEGGAAAVLAAWNKAAAEAGCATPPGGAAGANP